MKKLLLCSLVLALFALVSESAQAYPSLNYSTLSKMTDQAVSDTIRTVGIGADHRPYQSAMPLGLIIGLDVGIDVTAISIPQSFKDAMTLAGNTEKIPFMIPVPKLNIRKGLPFGIDAGASFISFQQAKIFGADVQYSLVGDKSLYGAAVRGSYNYSKLWYIKTTTYSFDLVGSLKVPMLVEPYAGLGWQLGSGDLEVPSGQLPAGVSNSQSYSNARFFLGLPFNLLLVHVTLEYGYSFANITTYGAKVSFSF